MSELVACREAMWEWVEDEQERWREKQEQLARLPFYSERAHEDRNSDEEMRVIRRMTRHEFDSILSRFEMCVDLSSNHVIRAQHLVCYIGT